jgi:hypothetical protein
LRDGNDLDFNFGYATVQAMGAMMGFGVIVKSGRN